MRSNSRTLNQARSTIESRSTISVNSTNSSKQRRISSHLISVDVGNINVHPLMNANQYAVVLHSQLKGSVQGFETPIKYDQILAPESINS